MKKSTRNLLLGVGAVAAVGGVAYVMSKETPTSEKKSTSGSGPGAGVLPKRAAKPTVVWSEALRPEATERAVDAFVEMGEPPLGPEVWTSITYKVASQLYPEWTWPTTSQKEAQFLKSKSRRVPVWQVLKSIAMSVTGYEGAGIS